MLSNLVKTVETGGDTFLYVYDGSGQRVVKINVSQDAATAYLGSTEVTDLDTTTNHTTDIELESTSFVTGTRFYMFGGATVAVREATPAASTLSLLLGDMQGSAQVMMKVDPDVQSETGLEVASSTTVNLGTDVTRSAYMPYGAVRGDDNLSIDHGWLNQVSDGTAADGGTGLVYLNARYYDPVLSRFVSPDPLMKPSDPRTLDPYRYADNNPISFTDASGLCSTTGNWAYVGGVLEPPCNKSNGSQYKPSALKLIAELITPGSKAGKKKVTQAEAATDKENRQWWQKALSWVGDRITDAPQWFVDRSIDYWDRGTTWLQYEAQAAWRWARDPVQGVYDLINGNLLAEQAMAIEQILIDDAELLNEGLYCGNAGECLTGGSTFNVNGKPGAITIGHTVTFAEDMKVNSGIIDEEFTHVLQYEILGAVVFISGYGGEYAVRRFIFRDPDAYENISSEQWAKTEKKEAGSQPGMSPWWGPLSEPVG